MEVEAPELRLRVRLGHHDDRRAVSASDIGNLRALAQLFVDAVECGYPLRREAGAVARAEEPLGSAEQAFMVGAPAQRAVSLVCALDLVDVHEQGSERVHAAGNERR